MKWLALALGVLAVGALVVVGTLVAVGGDDDATVAPADGVALGKAPPLEGTDPITGKHVSLADFKGKPVVINIWASWCPPCADEAPDLRRFAEKHPEAQLIGIDIRDTQEGARAFYRRFGWSHPSIDDPSGTKSQSLGIQGQPITYFLNDRHEIVDRILGASDLAGFEAGLERAKRS